MNLFLFKLSHHGHMDFIDFLKLRTLTAHPSAAVLSVGQGNELSSGTSRVGMKVPLIFSVQFRITC